MQDSNECIFKQLAKNAKQRLKNRSYKREEILQPQRVNLQSVNKNTKVQKLKCRFMPEIIIRKTDFGIKEEFANRVYEILKMEDTILNPIGKLVDEKHMKKLSSENKQRYLFDLSEKYNKIRENYEREESEANLNYIVP